MLKLLLQSISWLLAHTPEPLLRGLSAAIGEMIFWLLPRRRRAALSNLHHAFPDRSAAWRRAVARASSRRMVETVFFSVATPYLSPDRIAQIIRPHASLVDFTLGHQRRPRPVVLVSPHLAYWEAEIGMPHVLPKPFPEIGVIYRPLDNEAANRWVIRARERFGLKLLSRKEGFAEAMRILRRNGIVGILFDQNAGLQGALSTLLGRVCSTSELTGLLAEKFHCDVVVMYPRRLDFWRTELHLETLAADGTTEGTTIALNRWLEGKLTTDEELCTSWLWAHERWRNQDIPARRFRLEAKRDFLAADLRTRGWTALPRRTRVVVRMPNWLGDVVMALPLLRALRVSRPDAEITLLAKAPFLPLLESWGVADRLEALPRPGLGYYLHFWRRRGAYPDVWLLFTNSVRGDLEARLAGCPQRFGLIRPGKWRPLLSHRFRVPRDFDESHHHQLELWENFLRHFGLNAAPDRAPVARPGSVTTAIGLIAGSENNPAKRWPVAHWRALIEARPNDRFVLFGTANDRPITDAVAAGFGDRVENLAGRTSLPDYCARLQSCRALVTNDTGGMHLANALGVPLIALFGPTNPVRTGPVFSTPATILQPPGCPATGGLPLDQLAPAQVLAALDGALGGC
ncbi:MAG TPA: glycosyltransferase family 9 protein [Opitutaceae bacterium]|nr:glycosyltransferase family 9 protein [Opitutaceae bacterium]HND60114.1 glycosyltransferase family 9 protein [Opitutaceae bacterium]